MTMRARIERPPERAGDDWGSPEPPATGGPVTGTVPCLAWTPTERREIRDVGKEAVLEDLRAIVPHDADVLAGDRLTIEDRLGVVLYGGPMAVRTATRRGGGGSSPGHLEMSLTRHT